MTILSSHRIFTFYKIQILKGIELANIKSSQKRARQNEKRRIKNSDVRSSIRTSAKKVNKAIESKEEKDLQKIEVLFRDFVKKIDTASRKGIIHSNKAARQKSRMAKKINSLTQEK